VNRRRALLAIAGTIAILAAARPAGAQPLSPDERARLETGEVVRRPIDFESGDGDFFGGVSYAIAAAPAADVMRALLDVRALPSILPLTLEAREAGRHGDDRLVFLKQGGRLGTASYTLIVRRASPSVVRFWVDTSLPHEIEDGWGWFRVDPLGERKSLITYAVVVRIDGLFKLLFKEKIRGYMLSAPGNLRRYVEGMGR
jgi:Polyketide cyclase / dehydrase and lipid transport